MAATSLTEVLFVMGVAASCAAVALPGASAGLDNLRTAGAAQYLSTRLNQTRLRAVTRSADTAFEVLRDARGYVINTYEDGNRNGVLSADIRDGTDRRVGVSERLSDQFPGVDFGATADLPGADGSAPPGLDPVRLGASGRATFTPGGTATPGSLYVRGRRGSQYVVRIYGETGRTRMLRFNARTRTWQPR